jgi:hypothetical protein
MRNWVDAWLAEKDLIDPARRQHGLEMPLILKGKFEAAFFPVFGRPSGSDAELDLRGQIKRAQEDNEAFQEHLRILAAPWTPPEGLTPDLVKTLLGDAGPTRLRLRVTAGAQVADQPVDPRA